MTNPESIDELSYTYYTTSNQLKRVFDASNSIEGFKDVSSGDTDYTYDTHGNMTSDLNKNITQITYNHLNLPKKISFVDTNNYIEYTYDASGVKVTPLCEVLRSANVP